MIDSRVHAVAAGSGIVPGVDGIRSLGASATDRFASQDSLSWSVHTGRSGQAHASIKTDAVRFGSSTSALWGNG